MAAQTTSDRLRDPRFWVTPVVVALALIAALVIGRGFSGGADGSDGAGDGRDTSAPGSPAASESGSPSASPEPTGPTDCDPEDEQRPALDLGIVAATGDPFAPILPRPRVRRLVDLAAAAGASVVSTAATWPSLQAAPDRAFDFTALDLVIGTARSRGLDVRLRLDDVPSWAFGGPAQQRAPVTGPELRQWRGYVTQLLRHVKGRVAYVDVWDEPNIAKSWANGPDPAAYARLLEVTYDAVKAVDPDVQVVSGAAGGNDIGWLRDVYAAWEKRGSSGGQAETPFDLLGVHPWADDTSPTAYDDSRRYQRDKFGAYDGNFQGFRELHDVMAEHGDEDKPLYISQFGYGTTGPVGVPDEKRAKFATQALEVAACAGYVEAFSWYALFPTRWDPPQWSLVDSEFAVSRTYRALRAWSRR